MKHLSIATLLMMMASILSAQAQTAAAPVKIGYLADLSGPTSGNDGPDGVYAASMAIADYGGKVLNRNIELITADHQGKPDVGVAILGRWYDSDGVSAVVSIGNSALALAAQRITQERNRVAMITSAVSADLTNKACSPNSVHWITDTYTDAHALATSVLKAGGDTWFFMTVDYAMGNSLEAEATAVIKQNGGQVLGGVKHPFVITDLASLLLQAQATKAKVLGMASSTDNMQVAMKQAREFGINKNMQIVPLHILFNDVRTAGLDVMQGVLTAQPFYWNLNDTTRAWSERFFAERKRMPTEVQSDSYRAVIHYLQAVDAAGTLDGDAVVKKMKEMPIQDRIGTGGYIRQDGRVIRDMYLFQVKKPSESTAASDLYKVVRQLPSEELYRPEAASECSLFRPM